jgi:hypothetical protein
VPADWHVARTIAEGPDRWRVAVAGPDDLDLVVVAETRPEPMVSCGKPEPSDQTHYRVLSTELR